MARRGKKPPRTPPAPVEKAPAAAAPPDVEIPDDPQPPPVPEEARSVAPATRERARLAIVALESRGESVSTLALARLGRLGPRDSALMKRLYAEGVLPPLWWSWRTEEGTDRQDLRASLEQATSLDAIAQTGRQVATALASGSIDAASAKALTSVMAEVRKAVAVRKEVAAGDEPQRYAHVSEEAAEVARAVDRLVSDDRRRRALELVAQLLEEDLVDERNADTGGPGGQG